MPAERKDSRWDSADCQTRKLPSCSPFSPSVLGGPPARCKQGQCGGSLSFAGCSRVVILGVAATIATAANQTSNPKIQKRPRHRCVRSFSFPTRQRGSEVGSRAAGRPLPTATGKNTPGLRDTDAAAVRVCLFPPASCEIISEGK